MFRPRIIPVLLLKNKILVKSQKFRDYHYIGDPINAVKIFNDLKADELAFLDIMASREKRLISLDFIRDAGNEACMPFAAGGGIQSLDDIRSIIQTGAEKVVLCSIAVKDPEFVRHAAECFGSSSIIVCIDIKRNWLGRPVVMTQSGTRSTTLDPVEFAKVMENKGAGEIIVQSIDRDGTMAGYDIPLIRSIAEVVHIPVVGLGGAGSIDHLKQLYLETQASGLAAGSLFIYKGVHKGVLINYPEKKDIQFSSELV